MDEPPKNGCQEELQNSRLKIHADLQYYLNSHIVSSGLKKVLHWLLTSRTFTPQNVEDCKDFNDIWNVLSRMSFIDVGKYEKLKELCDRIEELKYMVPEIQTHHDKIKTIENSASRQNQNDEQDDSVSLWRSMSVTRTTCRCPNCGTGINLNVSAELDDEDNNPCLHYRRNESIVTDNGSAMSQKAEVDHQSAKQRWGHRRSASLPSNIKLSEEQGETYDDPCTLKSIPRQRHETEYSSQRRFDCLHFRSPSFDPFEEHQSRVPYTYSCSSLLEMGSLTDIAGQYEDPFRFMDCAGSSQSEAILFGRSPYSRSGSVSSLSSFVVFSTALQRPGTRMSAGGDQAMPPPSMQMNLPQMVIDLDAQLCIEQRYKKLQQVNRSFKHLAIYVHIATLAVFRREALRIRLKNCLANIYSLNNFWIIILNDCHNNAINITEVVNVTVSNLFNGCAAFVEYDLQTFANHISEIRDSVNKVRPVVKDIEFAIAELEQEFVKDDCQDDLLKLAAIEVRRMKLILSSFWTVLDHLMNEVESCSNEDITAIKRELEQSTSTTAEEKRRFLECMAQINIRWLALKTFCEVDCPKHGETRAYIRNLYKDEPIPGVSPEEKAWELARKMDRLVKVSKHKFQQKN